MKNTMVIRRKDGSIYKLRGPNKLLIEQEFWNNEEQLVIHNFDQLSKVFVGMSESPKPPPKKEPDTTLLDIGQIVQSLNDATDTLTEPEPIIATLPEPVVEPVSTPGNRQKSQFRTHERHTLFCLPAEVREHEDDLYEETIVHVAYKDPFRFQAAIAFSNDAQIGFWTTVEHVTTRSVIFHPTRYRWWQVQERLNDPGGDGFVLHCVPSKLKPDFSPATS